MPQSSSEYIVTADFQIPASWTGTAINMEVGEKIFITNYAPITVYFLGGGFSSIPSVELAAELKSGIFSSKLEYLDDVPLSLIDTAESVGYDNYSQVQYLVSNANQSPTVDALVCNFADQKIVTFLELLPDGIQATCITGTFPIPSGLGATGNINVFKTNNVPISYDIEISPDNTTVTSRNGRADLIVPLDQSSLLFTNSPVLSRPLRTRIVEFQSGGEVGDVESYNVAAVQQSLTDDSAIATYPIFTVTKCP